MTRALNLSINEVLTAPWVGPPKQTGHAQHRALLPGPQPALAGDSSLVKCYGLRKQPSAKDRAQRHWEEVVSTRREMLSNSVHTW